MHVRLSSLPIRSSKREIFSQNWTKGELTQTSNDNGNFSLEEEMFRDTQKGN